jgi:(1->4)-alpha-D-glucan 1-alpha-D-glucosylmutase
MQELSKIPSSVYRVQFGENLSIKDASKLLPYLKELGIEGFYCSPIFACADSSGYHVTDHNLLNPALGTEEDYEEFCALLQKNDLKQILDLIPNHMGIRENPWFYDVLEKGKSSRFASFFDITWGKKEQVIIPILGSPYMTSLKNKEVKLIWDKGFWIAYAGYKLPLSADSHALLDESPEKTLKKFEEPSALRGLLDKQHYRLVYWKIGGDTINYRRFFNIGELITLRMENKEALKLHHKWAFELLRSNKVQGLRIDHPDGLYDPSQYFEDIQAVEKTLIVVEKILSSGEDIPDDWQVDGAIGYEFLAVLNGLFIQKASEKPLTKIYEDFIEKSPCFKTMLYQARKKYIRRQFGSELILLSSMLDTFSTKELKKVIEEFIAFFPIYRTYIHKDKPIDEKTKSLIVNTITLAKKASSEINPAVFDYLEDVFLQKKSEAFIARIQQVTAAVMAKGLEDSVFYQYNRFISLNEVGSNPQIFGRSAEDLHAFNQHKLSKWPFGFLTTSTHDSKFSEDVRARMNVLSEMTDAWQTHLKKWKKENVEHKTKIKGKLFPDYNTEYYIYQILLGIWPDTSLESLLSSFLKAIREAGSFTSWMFSDSEYEVAIEQFVRKILNEKSSFYPSFTKLQQEVSAYGKWNSISSLIVKIGSCGVVDIYQGNESEMYCLMDPDNRQPINYDLLKPKLEKNSLENLKLFISTKSLNFRREHKELFLQGEYIPLEVEGKYKNHIIAFLRKYEGKSAIVVTGRFFRELVPSSKPPIGHECWQNTRLLLPQNVRKESFTDVFTGKNHIRSVGILIGDLFEKFPVSIIHN